jgi:hypothetical protein
MTHSFLSFIEFFVFSNARAFRQSIFSMTSTDGSYQFSMEMDDLISTTPYTRSSNRNRKLTLTKEKIIIQKLDNDMCATRSSQKSPLTSNDDSSKFWFFSIY